MIAERDLRGAFAYESSIPFAERPIGERVDGGICGAQSTIELLPGRRRAVYFVRPEGPGPWPGILYVHWYEPASPDSNRTQFLGEATEMAVRGAASLLIEAAWSEREWFLKRTQADDLINTVEIVVELRRAMDFLLGRSGVISDRFAYVGHDFGAMYGILAGSIDPRPTSYVIIAGTARFSDWYLYYPPPRGGRA